MSALIIYNIHLIFALDDSIMANIDRLNQFFPMSFENLINHTYNNLQLQKGVL